jgi:hypothetical protein
LAERKAIVFDAVISAAMFFVGSSKVLSKLAGLVRQAILILARRQYINCFCSQVQFYLVEEFIPPRYPPSNRLKDSLEGKKIKNTTPSLEGLLA